MGTEKITENVYVNTDYDGANVACINTSDGVVLVDTPMLPQHIEEWKAFVMDLNPKGIKYIINTHAHFDHIIGVNQLGGIVIMHEKSRDKILKGGTLRETMAGLAPGRTKEEVDFILSEPLIIPEISMSKDLFLTVGDHNFTLFHVGGHSDDSIIVYVVEEKVLLAGDNFTGSMHPYKGEGCFADWIEGLQQMKTFDVHRFIPGHGEVCGSETLDRFIVYFDKLWNLGKGMVEKGMSRAEMVSAMQEQMYSYYKTDPEMLERSKMMFDMGTQQLYKELTNR
jgi:cyclase